MNGWRFLFLCSFFVLAAPPLRADHGLRVPPGFEVTEFSDSKLANDIYCLTLDPKGRVVVSGRGYVRLLLDEAGTGRATRAVDFAEAPADGAMGLFWEGDDLYCVGGGGLRRYRNAGGAGARRPSELLVKLKTGGEHDAHAVKRGPDGWLYVLCGNNTGLPKNLPLLSTSPVKAPVAGYVLRIRPDLKAGEIVAHGFRNAYGMDFNGDGELFTFDSDNERCVALPWYEPTRCYRVAPGGHHGWLSPQLAASWRLPPHFLDVVPPIATLGRGSPTGVVCYRHTRFPAKYQGGLFLLDWTFGQIHFLPLQRSGSTYTGAPEIFLRSVGDNGFAPTAAAVHPLTGDLYVAIGGRGTRGAVYRIRYTRGPAGAKALPPPAPRALDWRPDKQADLLARATGADWVARRQALADVERHRARFTREQLEKAIRANAGLTDRGLRRAAASLLGALDEKEQQRIALVLKTPLERTTLGLVRPSFAVVDLIRDRRAPAAVRLDAVRIVQKALDGPTARAVKGTVWEGYARRSDGPPLPADARAALRTALPSGDALFDAELARTLALVEDDDPATLARVADFLTARSHPTDDVHYLIVVARLSAKRPAAITRQIATALLALDRKFEERRINRDTHWPLRFAELHAGLARRDGALNAALLASPAFGRPDHALLARLSGFDKRRAAELFLQRAARHKDFAWSAELVRLLAALPPAQAGPALRKLWGQHGLDEEILAVLANRPAAEDHARFLTGLTSARLATVRLSLGALEKLPRPSTKELQRDEAFALLRALRQAPADKDGATLRAGLGKRLQLTTGQKITSLEGWTKWFRKAHPDLAARLADAGGVDVAAWDRRLAGVNWKGDATRGKVVYVKASCAACHSGAAALGPDLRGVTARFSRADLFTAIIQPSKDVSPRYRTTAITTADGKSYQGLIVYEATDSVILQTGPATTVRLAHKQISERRLTAISLMPTGLIDRLSDREIADLYAYLRSLGAGGKAP
jgi:putative heme-binding domain-containing protein